MNSSELKKDLNWIVSSDVEHLSVYKNAGKRIFDRIAKKLEDCSSFEISKNLIGGSIGKNTSLGYTFEPDFDVVIFVDDVRPPLDDVVDNFYNILTNSLPTKCEEWEYFDRKKVLSNPFGITSLNFKTCIELPKERKDVTISFDLSPAVDLSSNLEDQIELVMEEIEKNDNPDEDWNEWSTSLIEENVEFVRTQPPFIHRVIRLAKLWDYKLRERLRNRGEKDKFSGRSTVIELIAIKAAEEEEGDIFEAFCSFLKYCEGIHNICINFCESYDSEIGDFPLILDSCNPYNNYAAAIPYKQKVFFKRHASKTLDALERLGRARNYGDKFDSFRREYLA